MTACLVKTLGYSDKKTHGAVMEEQRNGIIARVAMEYRIFMIDVHGVYSARSSLPWLTISLLNPLRKLLALLPNVHKVRPRLQHAERVAHKTYINRSGVVCEALLAFPLNLACPDTPLKGPQRAGS